jgi:hypothetical protein
MEKKRHHPEGMHSGITPTRNPVFILFTPLKLSIPKMEKRKNFSSLQAGGKFHILSLP